ncbi:cupin domain-containing protein [Bdellovibrio reynosensis]|uniref:Cupin domain-containing protein n=1 Tax=Bdellovibrio reynosensis TaxID=2835041 RepID=A0ABY4CA40_9BACT|nr:cupin domain-containing protein [Bdellovibrio reynosensis]UOF01349.1 cupin domain-containing protein [Bdellovibrio reynosensis]
MIQLLLALSLVPQPSLAADSADHIMMKSEEVKWMDAPTSLPKGAKTAVIYGDPSKEGPFAMRIKFPANYLIPPHTHPKDEVVTVISGTLLMGLGADAKAKPMNLPAGSFAVMKVGTQHFAKSEKEAVVQLNGVGPWGITYVNPADDPRTNK